MKLNWRFILSYPNSNCTPIITYFCLDLLNLPLMGNHTPPLVFFSLASPKFVKKKKKKKRQKTNENRSQGRTQPIDPQIFDLLLVIHYALLGLKG